MRTEMKRKVERWKEKEYDKKWKEKNEKYVWKVIEWLLNIMGKEKSWVHRTHSKEVLGRWNLCIVVGLWVSNNQNAMFNH